MKMTQETEEQRIERYKAHLDGNIESSLVRGVLSEDTTFVNEVENFYDLSAEERCIEAPGIVLGSYTHFEAGERNQRKIKKSPEDLVKILQKFDEKPFDSNKLRYKAVREDYDRWHDPSRKKMVKRTASFLGSIAITATGSIYGASSFMNDNLLIGGISVVAGLAGGYGLLRKASYLQTPKGTNNELKEYGRLRKTAGIADDFMDEHYKTHFIRGMLNKTS